MFVVFALWGLMIWLVATGLFKLIGMTIFFGSILCLIKIYNNDYVDDEDL